MKKNFLLTLFSLFYFGLSSIAYGQGAELFFSEYVESDSIKYIEIYNPKDTPVDLGEYELHIYNDGEPVPTMYTFGEGTDLAPGEVIILTNEDTAVVLYPNGLPSGVLVASFINHDGNDVYELVTPDGTPLDVIGSGTDGPWDVAGVTDATQDKVLVRKDNITYGSFDWDDSRGTTTTDSQWIVSDHPDDNNYLGLGSHSDVSESESLSESESAPAELFFSEYGESSTVKYIEIYNPKNTEVDLAGYEIKYYVNACTPTLTYQPTSFTFPEDTIASGEVIVLTNQGIANILYPNSDYPENWIVGVINHNGDDAYELWGPDGTIVDRIGMPCFFSPWDVAGVTDATQDKVLVRKDNITQGTEDWDVSRGTTTTDSQWIVSEHPDDNNYPGLGSHSHVSEPLSEPEPISESESESESAPTISQCSKQEYVEFDPDAADDSECETLNFNEETLTLSWRHDNKTFSNNGSTVYFLVHSGSTDRNIGIYEINSDEDDVEDNKIMSYTLSEDEANDLKESLKESVTLKIVSTNAGSSDTEINSDIKFPKGCVQETALNYSKFSSSDSSKNDKIDHCFFMSTDGKLTWSHTLDGQTDENQYRIWLDGSHHDIDILNARSHQFKDAHKLFPDGITRTIGIQAISVVSNNVTGKETNEVKFKAHHGCTDATKFNYNDKATLDDDSCLKRDYEGCFKDDEIKNLQANLELKSYGIDGFEKLDLSKPMDELEEIANERCQGQEDTHFLLSYKGDVSCADLSSDFKTDLTDLDLTEENTQKLQGEGACAKDYHKNLIDGEKAFSSGAYLVFKTEALSDLDSDGIADKYDPDHDGDGILNELDECGLEGVDDDDDPSTVNVDALTSWTSDEENDKNQNGCLDQYIDAEGTVIGEDLDSDDDGYRGSLGQSACTTMSEEELEQKIKNGEKLRDEFPEDENEWFDSDCDGLGNNEDAFPYDPDKQYDCDGDGIADNADTDDDGDGVLDNDDACSGLFNHDNDSNTPEIESKTNWNSNSDSSQGPVTDLDNDGCEDATEDLDDDDDGVFDENDPFPKDYDRSTDTDKDGLDDDFEDENGEKEDKDVGNNGIPDVEDISGCMIEADQEGYDPEATKHDSSACSDSYINDEDGDGYDNVSDEFPNDKDEWADTDGDGIGDNADLDDDNDQCLDESTTEDRVDDRNPKVVLGYGVTPTDIDEDGIIDDCDPDRDGDHILDIYETNDDNYEDKENTGTDPNNKDSDGDGVFDGFDAFPNDLQLQHHLLINEINFIPDYVDADGHPDHKEWIEVKNINSFAIDLDNYKLEGAVTYEFPDPTLAAGAFLVIESEDGYNLENNIPMYILVDRGEPLTLTWNDEPVQTVEFKEKNKEGFTLELKHLNPSDKEKEKLDYKAHSEDLQNWLHSEDKEGTEEQTNSVNQACGDESATNYIEDPYTVDNDKCIYKGCKEKDATNYNSDAEIEGECIKVGCMDQKAFNYRADATISGECFYKGCKDSRATNYDESVRYHAQKHCEYKKPFNVSLDDSNDPATLSFEWQDGFDVNIILKGPDTHDESTDTDDESSDENNSEKK